MIVQTKWILDIAIDSTGKDVIKMKIEKVSENQIRLHLPSAVVCAVISHRQFNSMHSYITPLSTQMAII